MILSQLIHESIPGHRSQMTADALAWASVLHDVKREDDWEDPEHGNRSADFVLLGLDDEGPFTPDLDYVEVSHLCRLHVPPDPTIGMPEILKIFKDADALDRWRIGDLNPNFLRLAESKMLTPVSLALWQETRHLGYDAQEDTFAEVIEKAQNLGLVE